MGYHMAVTDLDEGGTLEELASLPDQGVTSYKLFMAYKGALMVDDETLFRTMEVAAETGALVMVHAENGDAIDVLVKEALAEGNTEPHYHALTRPPETEGEATNRAIQLARVAGSPLYVVHVSCREAVEPIALAREKGWNVWGETCTQYFFVDYSFLERPELRGREVRLHAAAARQDEPGRALERRAHRRALRRSRPTTARSSGTGRRRWASDDFSKIPNGGPGLENRLQMIHEFGVRAGRITLNRMVELLATNPAKLFGLYPRKGTIAVGSDADIVVFDPDRKHTISAATHHSKIGLQPLRGHRGDRDAGDRAPAWQGAGRERRARGVAGVGQFVKRARFGEELRAARPWQPRRVDRLERLYDAVAERPPHETLSARSTRFERRASRRLGCGDGRDPSSCCGAAGASRDRRQLRPSRDSAHDRRRGARDDRRALRRGEWPEPTSSTRASRSRSVRPRHSATSGAGFARRSLRPDASAATSSATATAGSGRGR